MITLFPSQGDFCATASNASPLVVTKLRLKNNYWTLAFFAVLRWLTQKAFEDRQIIRQFCRLLTGRFQ